MARIKPPRNRTVLNSRPDRWIIFLLLSALLAEGFLLLVSPIPAWASARWLAALIVFLAFLGIGVWLIVRTWSVVRVRGKVILVSTLMFAVVGILFGMFAVTLNEVFGFYLLKEIPAPDGKSVYLYEHGCFPPDGQAECDYYSSEIRARIFSLPVTRTIYRCDCLFGEPYVANNIAEVPIEESRTSEKGVVRIDLVKRKVVGDG